MRDQGYATTSATHLSEAKYQQLMKQKTLQQAQERWKLDWQNKIAVVKFLVVERDLVALSGSWECLLRGADMGKLTGLDVQDPNGCSLLPFLLRMHPYQPLPVGFAYQVAPRGTKTVQEQRAGVIRLRTKGWHERHLCFLSRLKVFLWDCLRAGISVSNFLFRPETTNHQNFKDEALSSCCLNRRLQFYLQQLGLFNGETLHGIRRGSMQAEVAKGNSEAAVGAKALQVTPAVTTQYLDTSRETHGPARKKNSRRAAAARPKPY